MVGTVIASRGRQVWVQPLAACVPRGYKRSFTTRRVPTEAMRTVVGGALRPRSGDVVLAEVVRLGHHRRLETPDGRLSQLHVGDMIIVAYGDRYAPDQFEAVVPTRLVPAQLVAGGGIAALVQSRSTDVRTATDIAPVGLVGDERGRPLNLTAFRLPPCTDDRPRPRTVGVLGTSMNSGKTTTIRYLVHGMARAGLKPGATKVTGTGSGGDFWVMIDAGAHEMLDFTDAGMSSTYRQPMPAVEQALVDLVGHLTASGSGVNLVEVADGALQQETSRLLDSQVFRDTVDVLVFAASDAMGAAAGVSRLQQLGHEVVAVSGKLTRSPLARREAEQATGLPVLDIAQLADPSIVCPLLAIPYTQAATATGQGGSLEASDIGATQVDLLDAQPRTPERNVLVDLHRGVIELLEEGEDDSLVSGG